MILERTTLRQRADFLTQLHFLFHENPHFLSHYMSGNSSSGTAIQLILRLLVLLRLRAQLHLLHTITLPFHTTIRILPLPVLISSTANRARPRMKTSSPCSGSFPVKRGGWRELSLPSKIARPPHRGINVRKNIVIRLDDQRGPPFT